MVEDPEPDKSALNKIYEYIVTSGAAGTTVQEIYENLAINQNTIRSAIKRLLATHRILESGERQAEGGAGRPSTRYAVAEVGNELKLEHQQETAEEEKSEALLETIITYSMKNLPKPEDPIYGLLYAKLLSANAIDVLVQMAKWLCKEYNEQFQLLKNHRDDRDLREKYKDNLEKIREFSSFYFCSILGVPAYEIDENNGIRRYGPIRIEPVKRDDPRGNEPAGLDDEVDLRRYLRMSVFGHFVLQEFPVGEFDYKKNPVAGTDSSVYEIFLRDVAQVYLPNSSISLVTSIGVKLDAIGGQPFYDKHPEPKVLAQYEERAAIEEGFLIPPPGRFGFEEGLEERIQEAAMDLRQYSKDRDMLFSGEYPAKILFRDGRIFPLEYTYQDEINYGLHGKLVRASIRNFLTLTNLTNASKTNTLFCGYVKRTHLSIFAPLAIWYMAFYDPPTNEGPLLRGWKLDDFLSTSFSDTEILSNVFYSSRERADRTVVVTFRTLRRFQSTQNAKNLKNYEPTNDSSVWETRIKKALDGEDVAVDVEEVASTFGTLLARSAVLMFYSSLTSDIKPTGQKNIAIPRIEIMAPYDELDYDSLPNNDMKIAVSEREYVSKIIASLFGEKGVMTEYPRGDLTGKVSTDPEIFLAPTPVVLAHNYSKELGKIYSSDFKNLLFKTYRRMFGRFAYLS
jgi:hypothetical protein